MTTLNETNLALQVFNDCCEQMQGSHGGLRRRVEQNLARRGIRLSANQFEAVLQSVRMRLHQLKSR